jgi:threonylcarbamoyladenosine tRNA methylthiotransferase MtaB
VQGAAEQSDAGQSPGQPAPAPDAVKGLDRTRAMLKIQDGCSQFCSYCIIPYVRAKRYSMPAEEALARIGTLAAAGYKEVVLLGIHLGAYAWEAEGQDRLADLFCRILDMYPQIRFRLGSVEPMEATEKLLAVIRDYPNACKHLHLPLQSGCDSILRAMNRPYATADYRGKAEQIRRMIPGAALTTDIMAGFPGEGEEEHSQSLAFAEEMAFSRIHVFTYSRRSGTLAADMPGQVAKAAKDRRSKEFTRLSRESGEHYGTHWVGRRQQVLIEEKIGGGSWVGHSDNYLAVTCKLPDEIAGRRSDWRGEMLPLVITGKSMRKPGAWEGALDEYDG